MKWRERKGQKGRKRGWAGDENKRTKKRGRIANGGKKEEKRKTGGEDDKRMK